MPGYVTDILAWVTITLLASGTVVQWRDYRGGNALVAAGWVAFAGFWLLLVPHFAFEQKSIIETIGSSLAVPASLGVGVFILRGRDSLLVLSRAVALMGLIYFPFQAIPILGQWLIETVTSQTEFLMSILGYQPAVVPGSTVPGASYVGYRNTFSFTTDGGHGITYTIILACTGIGSMGIFAGIISAVRAPIRRKFRALAVSIPVIYGLNLIRNVFIGLSFGHQWVNLTPDIVMTVFGLEDPYMVSYVIADRLVSQSLSVVVLIGILILVVRELPEVLVIVEDILFVLTNTEYDLQSSLPDRWMQTTIATQSNA